MYISSNKLETRLYENRMKSYTERLAEIEERLVNIDVVHLLKSGGVAK
jgi:hypothetical protein